MDTADWTRIKAIFDEALDRPPAERAALLATRCVNEPDLRAEIESLLASHEGAGEFLTGSATDALPEEVVSDLTGHTLGSFRLIEAIGRGGMGIVYRAE